MLTTEISAASLTFVCCKEIKEWNRMGNCDGKFIMVELVERFA